MIEIIRDSCGFKILKYLNNNNRSQNNTSHVGRSANLDRTNMHRSLKKLNQLGLVEYNEINKKLRKWTITDKGGE